MKNQNYPLYETPVIENIRSMMENSARIYAGKTAVIYRHHPHDEKTVSKSYIEMRDDIRNFGTGMIARGARDKHVAIIGGASYKWICSYFASLAIGSVAVPVDKELSAPEIADILRTADVEYVIYSASMEQKIAQLKDEVSPDMKYIAMSQKHPEGVESFAQIVVDGERRFFDGDNSYYDYTIDVNRMACIVFTSGTTGKGKGVMLSQKNIASDMTQVLYNIKVYDKTMAVLPPHHTYCSSVVFVGQLSIGCTIYISSGIRYVVQEMKEQKPQHLILVPLFLETFHKKIWQQAEKTGKAGLLRQMIRLSDGMRHVGLDLRKHLFGSVLSAFGSNLKLVISGGAALSQDIIDTFDALGITILNGYGITECSPIISCNRNEYRKRYSVGVPNVGEEIKLIDVDENGEGEICVKGPNVMLGYYKNPEATAAAFDEQGFFKTGDFGRLDDEGWVYITGRLKNLIIFSNGKNVYPEEIEADISAVYGVNEVIVYAGQSRTDSSLEVIVAEIYPDVEALNSHGITDIQKYFENEIAAINKRNVSFKKVGKVKIRDTEFEKNSTKKIVRYKIDKSID